MLYDEEGVRWVKNIQNSMRRDELKHPKLYERERERERERIGWFNILFYLICFARLQYSLDKESDYRWAKEISYFADTARPDF